MNKSYNKRRKYEPHERKYRISIIEAMEPNKIEKFGFELSYIIFERSINKMEKAGDLAEQMALDFLRDKKIISDNYRLNKVIALGNIKIEADIIDYENKVIYEVKSRTKYEASKKAIKDKWMIFEYDKANSIYSNFEFKGMIVVNESSGPDVKRVYDMRNSKVNIDKMEKKFNNYYDLLSKYKQIKKTNSKGER